MPSRSWHDSHAHTFAYSAGSGSGTPMHLGWKYRSHKRHSSMSWLSTFRPTLQPLPSRHHGGLGCSTSSHTMASPGSGELRVVSCRECGARLVLIGSGVARIFRRMKNRVQARDGKKKPLKLAWSCAKQDCLLLERGQTIQSLTHHHHQHHHRRLGTTRRPFRGALQPTQGP